VATALQIAAAPGRESFQSSLELVVRPGRGDGSFGAPISTALGMTMTGAYYERPVVLAVGDFTSNGMTGAQWRELPERYPPYQTCHRRFQQWVITGKLEETLRVLARHLRERGQLHLAEAFVDATFASAKKGPCHRANATGEGHENHRYRHWQQSSSRRCY
jgi:transposase